MKTAGATGVLALQEHGLKEVPEGLFLLVKLRVSDTSKGRRKGVLQPPTAAGGPGRPPYSLVR